MKTPPFTLNEKTIQEKIQTYLIETGHQIKQPIRIKGRIPDIIAVKNNKITMIEVKGNMGDIKTGIAKTIDYTSGAHQTYLAIPKNRSNKKLRQTIQNLGLGLIEVDHKIRITIKPEKTNPKESIKKRLKTKPKKTKKKTPTTGGIAEKITKHKEIAKTLLKYPNRTFTIRELAKETETPYTTTWRHIQQLDQTGIITTTKIGPSTTCRLNKKTPYIKELKKIAEIETSPQKTAAKEYAKKAKTLKEVEKIILFGSTAKKTEKPTSDVDIAVIVKDKKTEKTLQKIADDILKTARIKTTPIVMTQQEASENKQFKKELEKGETLYERDKRG